MSLLFVFQYAISIHPLLAICHFLDSVVDKPELNLLPAFCFLINTVINNFPLSQDAQEN